MIVEFHDFDGSDPPGVTAPFRAELLHRLQSNDGSEYWLAEPEAPISYPRANGTVTVSHVIVAPGSVGASFSSSFAKGRVNLAYVVNNSQVTEQTIDFAKADYVAFGSGTLTMGGFRR